MKEETEHFPGHDEDGEQQACQDCCEHKERVTISIKDKLEKWCLECGKLLNPA